MTLSERIALHLGWTVAEVQSFSLATIRELVGPKLSAEIDRQVKTGAILASRESPVCVACGRPVEPVRYVYAVPHCFECLPPPPPLPIAKR